MIIIHLIIPSHCLRASAVYSPIPINVVRLVTSRTLSSPDLGACKVAYFFQPCFQLLQLRLFDNQGLVIEILNNIVVFFLVDLQDNCFDGRITLD